MCLKISSVFIKHILLMLTITVIIYLTLSQEENIKTQQHLLASVCSIWSKEHIN